jgi:hypothetical protein
MLAAAMVLSGGIVLAQGPEEPSLPKGFLVALLAGAPLIVAVGQLLRKLPINVPGWLKAILPALFGVIGTFVSNWAEVTVDLSPILGALLGTTANATFSVFKELGLVKGSGK